MKHSEKVYIVKQALSRALRTELGRPFRKHMRSGSDELRTANNPSGKFITKAKYKDHPREMPPVEAKPKINVEDAFLEFIEFMRKNKK